MSSPVLPEPAAESASRGALLRSRACVGLALVVSQLKPHRIRQLMSLVVRNGGRPAVEDVEHHRGLVVSVSTLCAGEGCLPRSIATALLARWHGYGVTWCTGVQDRPFAAHAWVEIDGRPVGESADLGGFRKMLVCTPEYASSGGEKN
ncbi:lasso peptide biosynthesis B2 protein [Nocardiopsis sp. NPDC006198]|uniref:lasso peptide biosynthesis B2 protein n=1 Tax=Nocardiopsis sp. NPDC006198 TaxID=3154472 RepID=UPI0033AC916F